MRVFRKISDTSRKAREKEREREREREKKKKEEINKGSERT